MSRSHDDDELEQTIVELQKQLADADLEAAADERNLAIQMELMDNLDKDLSKATERADQFLSDVGTMRGLLEKERGRYDALACHVNMLRDALFAAKGHIRGPEEVYRAAREAHEQTDKQSLSHIENKVIEMCAVEVEDRWAESDPTTKETIDAEDAVDAAIQTIRTLKRKVD